MNYKSKISYLKLKILFVLIPTLLYSSTHDLHGYDCVDSGIADNDNNEWQEENLTVYKTVIDIVPGVRSHPK